MPCAAKLPCCPRHSGPPCGPSRSSSPTWRVAIGAAPTNAAARSGDEITNGGNDGGGHDASRDDDRDASRDDYRASGDDGDTESRWACCRPPMHSLRSRHPAGSTGTWRLLAVPALRQTSNPRPRENREVSSCSCSPCQALTVAMRNNSCAWHRFRRLCDIVSMRNTR